MGLNLKRFPRYAQLLALLWRHSGDLFDRSMWESDLELEGDAGSGDPERLAEDLEKLGPTFVKLGQLLSSRVDLFPKPYIEALSRLQDDVEPFPGEKAKEIVERELGVRVSKAFEEFDEEPLASASLGQVHRAKLRNGREVAVKVQRPDIREQCVEDLDILMEVAELLDRHASDKRPVEFTEVAEDLRRTFLTELDYNVEAQSLVAVGEAVKEYDRLVVPRPVADYSTSRVLTMDYLQGTKITDLHPVTLIDRDREEMADQLFRAYLDQTLVNGLFHADPHPGNVLLTPDGRIALLDLGMVARLPETFRNQLLRLLIAMSEGNGSDTADVAIRMGKLLDHFDENAFRTRITEVVGQLEGKTVREARVSRTLLEISQIAMQCGMRLPRQFSLLGKTLMQLDELALHLAPDFSPNETIRAHTDDLLQAHMRATWSPSAWAARLLEMKELAEKLPSQLFAAMESFSKDGLRLEVDAIDEKLLIEGFQKVANRISAGLVLAALIVAGAMLMQVPSGYQLFGYPALGIVLFLIAVAGGLMLLWAIWKSDR